MDFIQKYEKPNKLYYEKYKGEIYQTPNRNNQYKSDYYVFDNVLNLWKYVERYWFIEHFNKFLIDKMKIIQKFYIENTNNEYGKMASILINNYKKRSFANISLTNALDYFYDKDFANKLDNHNTILSVKNGIINLKTGEFRERVKEDYLTFELDVEWKGFNYDTHIIDKFMTDILNSEQINKLQKALGSYLIGEGRKKPLILYGAGSNGKSTLVNMISKLLQGYCQHVPSLEIDIHRRYLSKFIKIVIICEIYLTFQHNFYGVDSYYKKLPNLVPIIIANCKEELKVLGLTPDNIDTVNIIDFDTTFTTFKSNDKNKKMADRHIDEYLEKHLDQLLVWLVRGAIVQKNATKPEYDYVIEI